MLAGIFFFPKAELTFTKRIIICFCYTIEQISYHVTIFLFIQEFTGGGNRSSSYLIVLHIINTNLIL